MKHLGDITNIKGDQIEPVDVIIGGSPCQDLSVAGKRAGLGGARSGLFMEQIRIIKEMRNRMSEHLPEDATMGSLFDGIGGFPLIGTRVGINPVWASEIEEFCIAVTKKHFGEE